MINDREGYERTRYLYPKCKNFEMYQKVLRANLSAFVNDLERRGPAAGLAFQKELLNLISTGYGVVCFSSDPTQHLMWAHYADRHRGILIEFDGADGLFNNPAYVQVEYSTDRVVFDSSLLDREKTELIVKRKSIHWRYEMESRLLVPLGLTMERIIKGTRMYFFKIPPELIVSVTFGLRATTELIKEVNELLADPKLAHVKRWQIETHDNKFEFLRKPV